MTEPSSSARDTSPAAQEKRWIEAGYCRIEGDLWCCPRCHSATPRPDDHDHWHESRSVMRRRP